MFSINSSSFISISNITNLPLVLHCMALIIPTYDVLFNMNKIVCGAQTPTLNEDQLQKLDFAQ